MAVILDFQLQACVIVFDLNSCYLRLRVTVHISQSFLHDSENGGLDLLGQVLALLIKLKVDRNSAALGELLDIPANGCNAVVLTHQATLAGGRHPALPALSCRTEPYADRAQVIVAGDR